MAGSRNWETQRTQNSLTRQGRRVRFRPHQDEGPRPSQLAEIAAVTDSSIARITGMFGVACVLLSWAQFPLWVIGGAPPFCDSEALARHLYDLRTTAFIRILMDQGIYVSMMIFAAGFRHLVRRARPESDWLGLLALVSAAVWLAVTLAADGLMGGAVLATLQGASDVSAALPLVFGTLLIHNGSIAFAITGLFMAAAGWATLDSGVLPRWTGWIAGSLPCCARWPFRRCLQAQQTHRGSTTRQAGVPRSSPTSHR